MQMELVRFTVEGAAAVSAREAFERVVPRDDSTLFRGFLVLPAVVGVSEQTGPWDRAGEQRTVHLSDGSSFREELTRFVPPATRDASGAFDYRVTAYTKLLALLVSDAEARWRFLPATSVGATGESTGAARSVIRWSYGFRPRRGRTLVVRLLIGPIWKVYMRRSMSECVRVAENLA